MHVSMYVDRAAFITSYFFSIAFHTKSEVTKWVSTADACGGVDKPYKNTSLSILITPLSKSNSIHIYI